MSVPDPAQVPRELMKPAMQPGQSPTVKAPGELPEITSIQRLTLRPGDSLVIHLGGNRPITEQSAHEATDRIRAALRLDASIPIVVFPADGGIEVMERQ